VVEVLGLVFIGLVSVAGFSVMAQRRLRALGMLSAIGATERNLRLVMITGGLAVGVAAALAGAVLGFAAWFAYVPTLQQATGHVVDAANVPWWAFGIGVVFAIATSVLASRRPAKTMAAVPVVAALSGRPAPPKAVHRSALPGVIVFAVGVACLAFTGGLAGVDGGSPATPAPVPAGRPGRHDRRRSYCSLRWPSACWPPGRARGCRSRSGSRCATWSATEPGPAPRWRRPRSPCSWPWGSASSPASRFDNPLDWIGPNLSSSQLIVYTQQQPGARHDDAAQQRPGGPPGQAGGQPRRQPARAVRGAAGVRGRAVPGGRAGARSRPISPAVYVATPQLLATYGIKASQIAPGTDFLTMRPGLAGLPRMEMTWGNAARALGYLPGRPTQ
jgi:putative ABC transport system permease protein